MVVISRTLLLFLDTGTLPSALIFLPGRSFERRFCFPVNTVVLNIEFSHSSAFTKIP